jgi:hypothetical protein
MPTQSIARRRLRPSQFLSAWPANLPDRRRYCGSVALRSAIQSLGALRSIDVRQLQLVLPAVTRPAEMAV